MPEFCIVAMLISINNKQHFVCNVHIHSLSVFVPNLSCQAPVVHLRCFVTGQMVPNILKCHIASIFWVKQISVLGLLVPEDKGTTLL